MKLCGDEILKKRIIIVIAAFLIFNSFALSAYAAPDVSAQGAVLICVNSGEVLFSKNADKRLSMASTTKIMTSLLALEYSSPDAEITVTDEMVRVEGTSMGLIAGDSVSLRELVYGMLLQSGNDAANAAAIVLGGSIEGFAQMMNNRAKQIGMNNTNFVTPSGLDDENHYSTAYDMALLACECIKNPEFAYICSQKKASVTYGNPPYLRTLTNHNRLLRMYGDAVGIKTGFTKKSGRCLVSAAERNGITLVAVTLKAPDDWNDHIALFEYGFSLCKGAEFTCDLSDVTLDVAGGTKNRISVTLSDNVQWLSGKEVSVRILMQPMTYAPVSEGEIVGKAVFSSDSRVIGESLIFAAESVDFRPAPEIPQESDDGLFSAIYKKLKDLFNVSEVK